jgi:hypothetical protein
VNNRFGCACPSIFLEAWFYKRPQGISPEDSCVLFKIHALAGHVSPDIRRLP